MSVEVTIWCTAVTLVIMFIACNFDLKFREIPDAVWFALGCAGLLFTILQIPTWRIEYVSMLCGAMMIVADIVWTEDRPKWFSVFYYVVMLALTVYPMVVYFDDPIVKRLSIIPICFVIFYALYLTGILRGGADAKCLMVLAMAFQVCPTMGGIPLIPVPSGDVSLIISFPIAVLFHALLLTLVWLIWIIVRKKGPISMRTLAWYKLSIDKARESFVWPKQDVIDGLIVNVKGMAEDGALDRLEQAGAKDVWVTPMIPFMVPITAAMIFIILIGNLLFIPFI